MEAVQKAFKLSLIENKYQLSSILSSSSIFMTTLA